MKNELKRAGKNYYIDIKNIDSEKYSKIRILIVLVISTFFLFFLLLSLGDNWIITSIYFCIIIIFNMDWIFNQIFGNISGIYENGIINQDKYFVSWNEVYLYSIVGNTFSGYLKKGDGYKIGDYFEYIDIENIEEINVLLKNYELKKINV
jgi:hypothetical protein